MASGESSAIVDYLQLRRDVKQIFEQEATSEADQREAEAAGENRRRVTRWIPITGSALQSATNLFTWGIGGLLVLIFGFIAYWVKRQDNKSDILFEKFSGFEEQLQRGQDRDREFRTDVSKDVRRIKRYLKLNGAGDSPES